MHRTLAIAVALLSLVLGFGSAAAQPAPAGTLPVTPEPSECGIAPRSADELADLAGATPDAEATAPAMAFVPLTGEPADAPTVAFALSILREAIACGNANGFLGAASLVTNAVVARGAVDAAGGTEFLTFPAGAPPPTADERRSLLAVLDPRDLGQGRVGLFVVVSDPTRSPAARLFYVVVAEGAEGAGGSDNYLYLIDTLVADPFDLSATPAA